jgi:hypothetical protein
MSDFGHSSPRVDGPEWNRVRFSFPINMLRPVNLVSDLLIVACQLVHRSHNFAREILR